MTTSLSFLSQRSCRGWPIAAVIVAIGAAVLAALAHGFMAAAILDEALRQQGLRTRLAEYAQAGEPPCAPTTRYAQSLPTSASIDRLVQSLQDSSRAFGVELVSVSSEPHAETARALAGIDVDVSLHGTYPGIKSALAEAFSRFPTAVLRRLRLRRDGQGMAVEDATAQFVLPLRPSPAPADCIVAPTRTSPPAVASPST